MVAFRAELEFDGEKTPASVATAMHHVLAAGIPPDARLSFMNGQKSWTVTATWNSETAPAPKTNPYRKMNLDALAEEIRIAEGKQSEPGQSLNQGDRDTPPEFEWE